MASAKQVFDKSAGVIAAIQKLADTRVMVGVPAEKALRKPDPDEERSVNNAMLAYIHENGSEEARIPPRPFLKPAMQELAPEINRRLRQVGDLALDGGEPERIEKAYHGLGLVAQAAVRNKINEGVPPPLSLYTIRKRAARGRKGARQYLKQLAAGQTPSEDLVKPLIDTGQLRNAINYVVRSVRALF